MNKVLKDILDFSIYILIVIGLTFLLLKFVAQRSDVHGISMMPTLEDGDNLILNKVGYLLHDPERFDIVVFPFRDGSNKNYIKRVIALPGETVRIDEAGVIYINDVELVENYGSEVIKDPGNAYTGITLGDDEFFVMGDNRNHSDDSRFNAVKKVNRDEIIGKAWLRFYPFKKFGTVR